MLRQYNYSYTGRSHIHRNSWGDKSASNTDLINKLVINLYFYLWMFSNMSLCDNVYVNVYIHALNSMTLPTYIEIAGAINQPPTQTS